MSSHLETPLVIRTVHGDLAPAALGPVLMHEHLVTDMRPEWEQVEPPEPLEQLVGAVLPALEAALASGVRTLVECTPTGLGQRLDVYRAAAERAGIVVVAAVGTYRDAWLPPWVRSGTVEALAAWYLLGLRERSCGFVKLGCDPDGPSADEAMCARAAGTANRQTGVLVACHVGRAAAAQRMLDAFECGGGDPRRFVVVHLQNETDFAAHLALARRGAWIEYDGVGGRPDDATYCRWVLEVAAAGHAGRLLTSQDACAYIKNAQGAVSQHPPARFSHLFRRLLPALRAAGADEALIQQLVIENPQRALAFRPP